MPDNAPEPQEEKVIANSRSEFKRLLRMGENVELRPDLIPCGEAIALSRAREEGRSEGYAAGQRDERARAAGIAKKVADHYAGIPIEADRHLPALERMQNSAAYGAISGACQAVEAAIRQEPEKAGRDEQEPDPMETHGMVWPRA
jgi:hypothetical protein